MSILLLTADLATASRIRGAAQSGGHAIEVCGSAETLLAKAEQGTARLVILDLAAAGVDPAFLVPRLKLLSPAPTVVAFGPHVHEARLESARQAGCDAVHSRGAMLTQAESVLKNWQG